MSCFCRGPDCELPTEEGRSYCEGHRKQQSRVQPLRPIARDLTPFDRLLEAFWNVADAEEDEEFEEGRRVFLRCVEQVMIADGWRPPTKAKMRSRSRRQLALTFDCGESQSPERQRMGA